MADELPSTPSPSKNYLPTPPITPIAKRSAKRELSEIQFDKSDAPSPSVIFDPPKKSPRKVGRPPKRTTKPKSPRITKHRIPTEDTKLSLRRKLVATYGAAKRLSAPAKAKRPIPSKVVGSDKPRARTPLVKVKSEDHVEEYFLKTIPAKKKGRKPTAAKGRKLAGRRTNNSLSATLSPMIRKRKVKSGKAGRWEGGIGKVCASYYASARGIVPHTPGERYHKGKPYFPSSSCHLLSPSHHYLFFIVSDCSW